MQPVTKPPPRRRLVNQRMTCMRTVTRLPAIAGFDNHRMPRRRRSLRRPSIEVSVRELLLGHVEDMLDGNVERAFTRLAPGQADLELEVLSQEPRLVALASTHPAATRQALTFAELDDDSFIINPAVPDQDAPPRWLAEQQRHGLTGRVAARSASIQEILSLVAAGRGVCLVPSTVVRHHPRPDVTYVPVTDADPAPVSLARRHGQPTAAQAAFIEVVREVSRATHAAVSSR
jgi:DNA-binding transcriptional LysR family regulator